MPVYYNKKRVGRTYREAMKIAHDLAGERIYELPLEMKKKFDVCFSVVRGNYPKLVQTVIPLDEEEPQVLPGFSGVLVKYEVRFERKLYWKVGEKNCTVTGEFHYLDIEPKGEIQCWLSGREIGQTGEIDSYIKVEQSDIMIGGFTFGLGELEYERLGSVWDFIFDNCHIVKNACIYQGIVMDKKLSDYAGNGDCMLLLLEGKWKPTVKVSRSEMVKLPLEILMAIRRILDQYGLVNNIDFLSELADWNHISLREWRELQNSAIGQWMIQKQKEDAEEIIRGHREYAGNPTNKYNIWLLILVRNAEHIMYKYAMAYLQDHYDMEINYENGQIITFHKKKEEKGEGKYDIFPPMMFCKAASSQSRKYICHAWHFFRRAITEDHPMIAWLLENAALLNRYFQRQFRQMVECLYQKDARDIVQEYRIIREQFSSLSNCRGLDVKSMPVIGLEDFWEEEEEERDV